MRRSGAVPGKPPAGWRRSRQLAGCVATFGGLWKKGIPLNLGLRTKTAQRPPTVIPAKAGTQQVRAAVRLYGHRVVGGGEITVFSPPSKRDTAVLNDFEYRWILASAPVRAAE